MKLSLTLFITVVTGLWVVGCQTSRIEDAGSSQTWGPARNGLRVQLREIPNTMARGYLKLLALSVKNVSDKAIRYDDQQVACNDSLIVKRDGMLLIPFRQRF